MTINRNDQDAKQLNHQNLNSLSQGDIGDFSPKVPAHLDQYPCDISAQERGALSPCNSDEPESP